MSAIDNAFIRAYTRDTAVATAPAPSDFDDAIETNAVSEGVVVESSLAVDKSSRRPIGSTAPTAAVQIAGKRPEALATPPRRSSIAPAVKAPTSAPISAAAPARVVADPVVPAPHVRLDSFVQATTIVKASSTVQDPVLAEVELPVEESKIAESSDVPAVSPEISPLISPLELASAPIVSIPSTLPFSAEVAAKSELESEGPRAAFEVDHFNWPELCDALLEKRASEFDQLVGQLVTESALGRKVVAITGSRRGDGRTTLALLLARRLAATAVKVAVVDADFEVPQLAARLGMAIKSGWENVLTDKLPVWDGLIESLEDRISLLPLAPRPTANAAQQTATEFVAQHAEVIRQHLDTLRKQFDVVLVDVGVIKSARPDAKPRGPMALADSLDAAIIVSDMRMAAPGRLADLHRRLQEANIVPLGIAENFCPSKPN